MGFENLYRQGAGEASVINLGGVVNQYAQQLQSQALRRQKEQESYAKELSALNFDGVRQADVPAAQKKWLAVKDKYHELSKTDRDSDKLRIRAEIAFLKNDLTSFSKRSIEEQKTTADIAKIPLVKNKYEIASDFGERLKGRESLSIEDPRFVEYGVDKFQAKARPYDTTKNLMDLANISSTEKEIPITIGTGLDTRRAYQRGKVIDEVAFKSAFLKNIAEDDHARDTYLNGLPPTPENLQDASQAAFDIVKEKFGLRTTEGNYVDAYGREVSLIKKRAAISDSYENKDGAKTTQPIFRQDWINDMLDQIPGSGEQLLAIAEASGRFGDKKVKVITGSGGKVIGFKIPYEEATGKDGYNMIFNPNNRKEAAIKLNTLLNDLTGEKINQSTLMTEGGKKKVAGGKGADKFENKTPTKSNGFSLDDYLKKKGLK